MNVNIFRNRQVLRCIAPCFSDLFFFVQFDNKKPKSTKMYKFFSDKALMFYTKILISV